MERILFHSHCHKGINLMILTYFPFRQTVNKLSMTPSSGSLTRIQNNEDKLFGSLVELVQLKKTKIREEK